MYVQSKHHFCNHKIRKMYINYKINHSFYARIERKHTIKYEEIVNYLKKRNAVELEKISDGKNPEVEKRYDRYVDYG